MVQVPGWAQTLYVITTLGLGGAALGVTATSARYWWVGALPLYFVFDLARFIIRWLLFDQGPLISSRRSLGLFLLNNVSVIVFFGAAFVGLGCIADGALIPTALYASFRTFTTMGPVSIQESCWPCQVLVMAEGTMGYLLTAAVIGAVAGLVVSDRK